jgi:hypothetical protein
MAMNACPDGIGAKKLSQTRKGQFTCKCHLKECEIILEPEKQHNHAYYVLKDIKDLSMLVIVLSCTLPIALFVLPIAWVVLAISVPVGKMLNG